MTVLSFFMHWVSTIIHKKGAGYSDYSCQSKEKLSANNTSSNTRKLKIGTEVKYY